MIERSYDRHNGIVVVTLSGTLSLEEFDDAHYWEVRRLEKGSVLRSVLLPTDDLIVTTPLETKALLAAIAQRRRMHESFTRVRTAIVTENPEHSAYAEFSNWVGESQYDEIRLFSTRKAATAWLVRI